MSKLVVIGLFGGSDAVESECRASLAPVAGVLRVIRTVSAETLRDLGMLILVLDSPDIDAMRRFGSARELAPNLPVLLLTRGVDVNSSVELVKLGAADLLELPASHRVLAKKIERVVRGTNDLTIESLLLSSLASKPETSVRESSRCSFRAAVPARLQVSVILREAGGTKRTTPARLVDLSMCTESTPAGMALMVSSPGSLEPGADSPWRAGADVELTLEAFGRVVTATGCIRRSVAAEVHADGVLLGLTFQMTRGADEALVQRIWIEAQRREPAAGAGRPSTSYASRKPVNSYFRASYR